MTTAGTAAATAPHTIAPIAPTATTAARQVGLAGSTTTAASSHHRTLPSPSIPSPSSMPNSSTPTSSINTPTSGQPFDDLDARVAEFRQRWLAVKSHAGPDMATPCPEYVTFLPRVGDPSTWYSSVWNMGQSEKEWVVPPMPIPVAEKYAGFLHGQHSSRKGDTGRHSSSSSHENDGSATDRSKSRFQQNPPTPPLEEIRKNIEMIRNLPPLMSPSIPTWPEPSPAQPAAATASLTAPSSDTNASFDNTTNKNTNGTAYGAASVRRLTGGKQPGKVPHMPAHLSVSSDEDDSDDSDPFSDSNRATSDSDRGSMMSEIETNSRGSKSVGGKSKLPKEALRGKRPTSISRASKTISEAPPKSPQAGTRARKSSAGSNCVLLTKSQVAVLAQQRSDMTLSGRPVVVRINIPSSLLPALKSLPHAMEKAKTSLSSSAGKKKLSTTTSSARKSSLSSTSKLKSLKDTWGSDSDSDMDRSVAGGTASERDDSTRSRLLAKRKDSSSSSVRVARASNKGSPRRRRSYDTEDSDSGDRRKANRKIARRGGTDDSDDDGKGRKRNVTQDDWPSRKRRRDSSPLSPLPISADASKRGSLDSTTSSNRRDSVLENSRQDSRRKKYDEPERRSTDRLLDSRTLSPAEERARDRLRRPSYHSADEGEIVEYERPSHVSSMESRDRLDSKSSDKSRAPPSMHSRRESDTSKDKGSLRDRDDDAKSSSSRQKLQESISRSSKDDSKDKERERERDKDRDAGYGRRDSTKDDLSRSGQKTSTSTKDLPPLSPTRRSGRDDYRDSKSSRSTSDQRESGTTSKDRSSATKDRHGTVRSRSRSRSRSPVGRSGRYDRRSPTRGGERDSKSSSRRDYEDDRNTSSRRKTDSRARDSSRDRSDRRGRSRERSGRDRSRSPDRDWSRDRNKRARSRDYADSRDSRKDKDRRRGSVSPASHRGEGRSDPSLSKSALAAQEGSNKSSSSVRHDGDSKDKEKEKDKDGRQGPSSTASSQARRPSQAVRDDASTTTDTKPVTHDTNKAAASSTANGGPDAASATSSSASSAVATKDAVATPKKTTISMADYQKKRAVVGSDSMDTPKLSADSPALTSSSSMNGKSSTSNQDSSKASSDKRSKPAPSPEVSKKMNEYQHVFSTRTAEGANYKHTADATRMAGDNPRLCAIQYFMAGIEFIAAYVANDKYHLLANPDRPDIAVHDSIGIWETMRQFTYSVTHQCRSNHLTGLDGLSALLEVLVYYKVYNYHMLNLRTTMMGNSNFKPDKKEDKDKEILLPKSLASRMLQCTTDWYHINKRSDEVKLWFTMSAAQKAFPDSFAKYCLTGKETSVSERLVPGTSTPKLHFPLGLHSDLQEVMAFAESALREYQKRNGLEFVKQTKDSKDKDKESK